MKKMIAVLTACAMLAGVSLDVSIAGEALIRAALASEFRTPEARERDARSKPDVILGLLDLAPGNAVADILGGGGYYTDILSGVVGPDGLVILHNNTPYSQFVADRVQARYVDEPVPGIRYVKSDVDDLGFEAGSLDAALMVMSFHDLYYVNEERGWGETDMPLFLAQVHEALKPGGRFLIVDHSAEAGAGSSVAGTIHRIDEAFVRDVIEAGGFRLAGSSDALRNPDDDRKKMVFDKSIRGKTDRFVLLFEKE